MNKLLTIAAMMLSTLLAGCCEYSEEPSADPAIYAPSPDKPKLRARYSNWVDDITDAKSSIACIDPDTSAPDDGHSLGRVCLRKDGKKQAIFFDIGAKELMARRQYQTQTTYGWYTAGLAEIRIQTPDGKVFRDTFETVMSDDGTKSFVRNDKTAAQIASLFERGASIKVRFTLADTQQVTLSYSNYIDDLKEVTK